MLLQIAPQLEQLGEGLAMQLHGIVIPELLEKDVQHGRCWQCDDRGQLKNEMGRDEHCLSLTCSFIGLITSLISYILLNVILAGCFLAN